MPIDAQTYQDMKSIIPGRINISSNELVNSDKPDSVLNTRQIPDTVKLNDLVVLYVDVSQNPAYSEDWLAVVCACSSKARAPFISLLN